MFGLFCTRHLTAVPIEQQTNGAPKTYLRPLSEESRFSPTHQKEDLETKIQNGDTRRSQSVSPVISCETYPSPAQLACNVLIVLIKICENPYHGHSLLLTKEFLKIYFKRIMWNNINYLNTFTLWNTMQLLKECSTKGFFIIVVEK